MINKITYNYVPENWDNDRFLALGGFVIVFLNYNKTRTIEKSVAAALNQDYPLLEMFFMDDASTDGSADIMEEIVRDYRGRHKVCVVRNSVNQYITGQWNTVARMASGRWLGMFCADDIAYPNRVSVVARRLKEYPTALGVCTSGDIIDELTGDCLGHLGRPYDKGRLHLMTGQSDLLNIAEENYSVMGATAFWHKSLFCTELPKVKLDDILIRWVLILRTFRNLDVNFVWDGTVSTIAYNIGSGVSSGHKIVNSTHNSIQEWMNAVLRARYYAANECDTWRGIRTYLRQNKATETLLKLAERMEIMNAIRCGSLLDRLKLVFRILCITYGKKHRSPYGRDLLLQWLKITSQELFGLQFAAYVSIYILKRGRCNGA